MAIDQPELLDRLRARVAANLESLTASQANVQSGAIHEEHRQEHPKDTRATEASYLARGLAERVESMRDMVAALAAVKIRDFAEDDPIALTALVALEQSEGARPLYFLVPSAGGETLEYDGETIHTVTPEAPVGRALIGQFVGDEIDLELPRGIVRSIVGLVE